MLDQQGLRRHARTTCRSRSSTTRLELPEDHAYYGGIDTTMSIDRSTALAVRRLQGRGRPAGAGVRALLRHADRLLPRRLPDRARRTPAPQLHGFLSYLMRCTVTGEPYTVFGYDGKQVRDNIHCRRRGRARSRRSTERRAPRAVYNLGGGRAVATARCSRRSRCASEIAGRELDWTLLATRRASATTAGGSRDLVRLRARLPGLGADATASTTILREIHDANVERWSGRRA